MRITGGSARGRKLASPRSGQIRPTCDRVREALFNIVGQRIAGSRVLDLFAGTGAIGIEALSRGAASVLFVDQSAETGRLIETNLRACIARPHAAFAALNLATSPHLHPLQAAAAAHGRFDLAIMDPPYQKNLAQRVLAMVEEADILAEDGLIIVEEHRSVVLPESVASLALIDHRRYGETGLWFFTPNRPHAAHE
ncbi:MAG: 16S rRNA (guanine(966)-N(2))-methyltransferase RsmD [Desulfobulbus sp.]|uniref:16S rRNA (guanine(966)-N(2))-methyltransferase RsmD n=1 Tax=Desulfobulbus sp. TaxID=895 RepID=UPI00283FD977|nr:16S rRNA (guanine(966)-N(2))-methyltransferase RsmD [Desulfobulbus sp.]MDR2549446.1 16S rRNA (guanine(966)-N(2))-methyltransferase RsmD [Desulfobulbus sp.]